MMHHIIYISTATLPLTEPDLEGLLKRWRANNQRDAVTGILLYNAYEARFMQIIEGEKATIKELFGKIENDSLHRSIMKLADGPIRERNFATWLMSFHKIDPADFARLHGYVDPNSPALHEALTNTHDKLIRSLVETFAADDSPELH